MRQIEIAVRHVVGECVPVDHDRPGETVRPGDEFAAATDPGNRPQKPADSPDLIADHQRLYRHLASFGEDQRASAETGGLLIGSTGDWPYADVIGFGQQLPLIRAVGIHNPGRQRSTSDRVENDRLTVWRPCRVIAVYLGGVER